MFLVYFPRAKQSRIETSCHLVASMNKVGQKYQDFGDLYSTEEFVERQVMPAYVNPSDYLAVSSDEDD